MRAAAVPHPCALEAQQLIDFVDDIPGARSAYAAAIRQHLMRAARALTRGWSAQNREEVVPRAFEFLLQNPRRFDPARGTAAAFLSQVAREAARSVRSAYAPPGVKKRTLG